MKLGFTGTREGMTAKQKAWVRNFIVANKRKIEEVHHGDCVGADDQFDTLVREEATKTCKIVVHPSNIETTRAYVDCKGAAKGRERMATVMLVERPAILRDCDIVEAVDVIIATPKTKAQEQHSGTWFTYRYAKGKSKVVYLIYPDGGVAPL